MEKQIIDIVSKIKNGQVATVPTETVFGYAVSLGSDSGIKELMKIKDRDFNSGKVFTLVPKNKSDISKYAVIPDTAKELIKKHMPGEITLILPKNPQFKHFYYDNFSSIGIRIPNHPFFRKYLESLGPLLLTSANPRGGTPKSETGHKPSTIVDFTSESPRIVRQGDLVVEI